MAIPWVSEAITSTPNLRAHSARIRVRNNTPCPPLPVIAICIFIENLSFKNIICHRGHKGHRVKNAQNKSFSVST
jgi:hypothetical protein